MCQGCQAKNFGRMYEKKETVVVLSSRAIDRRACGCAGRSRPERSFTAQEIRRTVESGTRTEADRRRQKGRQSCGLQFHRRRSAKASARGVSKKVSVY